MTRTTSAEAWREIQEDGTLTNRQSEVFRYLEAHGPMTAEQLTDNSGIPGAWKRLSELEDMGMVESLLKTTNKSGKRAFIWAATGMRAPMLLQSQKAKVHEPRLMFYSHSLSKEPSKYYTNIHDMMNDVAMCLAPTVSFWTGSHSAPIPLEVN